MKKELYAAPRCAPPILGLIYAGLLALSTLRGYFHLVELPWYFTQFAYAAIIALAAAWVFYSGETGRLRLSSHVMLLQMLPSLAILLWSMVLWIARQEPLRLILRGSSMVLYHILLLAMLMAAGVMFGKRAVEYTSLGFIMANGLILLDVMRRNGAGQTVSGMVPFLMSLGSRDNAISAQLEVQDLTFGIAILLLYYLICGKEEPRRWAHIVALTFFFFLGFKRILFPAIAVGAMYLLIMERLPRKGQVTASLAIGLLLTGFSLAYVALIRTGAWIALCRRFGIDLMGRDRLYDHMKAYYEISPSYLGIGSGRVSTVLEVVEKTGNRRLHSDVLRLYIELGMPVFLLWCYLTFMLPYTYLEKRCSIRTAGVYMGMTLLMFVTFLTDNTLEKFCPEIAWHLLPLTLALREHAAQADRIPRLKERNALWTMKTTGRPAPSEMSLFSKRTGESTAEALRMFRLEKWKDRP